MRIFKYGWILYKIMIIEQTIFILLKMKDEVFGMNCHIYSDLVSYNTWKKGWVDEWRQGLMDSNWKYFSCYT